MRFSLRSLLITAPIAGMLMAWIAPFLMQHDRTEVTAFVEIVRKPFLLWERPANPQIELIEAVPDDVLQSAVQSSTIDVAWLRSHVRITVVHDTLLRFAIVNDAPTMETIKREKDAINAIALSLSTASPSNFHALFARYPSGIKVVQWAGVAHHRHGWF